MAKAKDSASEEPFKKLEDELRNVLSGLNNPTPAKPDPVQPLVDEFKLVDDKGEEGAFRETQPLAPPTDQESEKLGEAAFRQASEPMLPPEPLPPLPQSAAPPSDADFWKGNVLGWTEDSDPIGQPAEMEPPPSIPDVEKPKSPIFPEPAVENPWTYEKPVDLPQIFKSTEKSGKKPVSPTPPQEESPLFIDDFPVPPMPTPPQFNEALPEIELGPLEGNTDSPPAPPVEPGGASMESSFMAGLRVPVPGTLHQMADANKKPKADKTLEEMSIKATHQIQVACLFPEGEEQAANNFIQKLRMAAAKTPGIPEIETVLTTPWVLTQINIATWKKAASLSGAHFMFVLASRKDKDLFKDLSKVGHKDEVKARVVYMEQIAFKTLYADLLPDLVRNFNVQS